MDPGINIPVSGLEYGLCWIAWYSLRPEDGWSTVAHWWAACQARSSTSINPSMLFQRFNGYNDPVARKQKAHRLDWARLEALADDLHVFGILEQPWMATRRRQEMKKDLLMLADSLQKYANYLKHQNEVVSAHHKNLQPVRDLATSTVPQLLPLTPAIFGICLKDSHRCSQIWKTDQELTSKNEYEPLLLN